MSLFITFEGVEGSGKTTQIQRLKKYLTRRGLSCKMTREPGGGFIGEKIRKILLDPKHREMTPVTELLLYEAGRAQHMKEIVQPFLNGKCPAIHALKGGVKGYNNKETPCRKAPAFRAESFKKGVIVLCDRFTDATLAYQGYGRGIDLKEVERLNRLATRGIRPDITFLLDCPPDTGLKRAIRRNREQKQENEERFEKEKLLFHRKVRKGYLAIAQKEPKRVNVINACESEEKVFEKIRRIIDKKIGL